MGLGLGLEISESLIDAGAYLLDADCPKYFNFPYVCMYTNYSLHLELPITSYGYLLPAGRASTLHVVTPRVSYMPGRRKLWYR